VKYLYKTLLVGLSFLLPVVLSLQLTFWLIQLIDEWSREFILLFLPETSLFPGLATLVLAVFAFAIGLTVKMPILGDFWKLPGRILEKLPGFQVVYGMIKDFFDLMSGEPFAGQSVVWVNLKEDSRLLGIITKTGKDSDSGLGGLMEDDEVAVFLPMSYQAGGYTLVLPKDKIQPADMEPGEALQLIMSAGLGKGKSRKGK